LVYFAYHQFFFLVKYGVLHRPHPEPVTPPSPFELLAASKPAAPPAEEMPPLMVSRRDQIIADAIQAEKVYQESLELLQDNFVPILRPIAGDDLSKMLFGEIPTFVEISVRFYVLLSEERKDTAEFAQIGRLFLDHADDLATFSPFINDFVDVAIAFNAAYHDNKKLKAKVKALERRHNQRFLDLISLPAVQVTRYSDLLDRLLRYTPQWHFDHETIVGAMDQLASIGALSKTMVAEAFRRIQLNRLERKIRKCPPLAADNRRLLGTWPLTEEAISLYLFSDRIMILQQKTEILSRKKYFIIRKDFFLREVVDVTREKNGIKLRMTGISDIVIMISLKGNDLMDAIKVVIQPK
jgi:hypothetical protein